MHNLLLLWSSFLAGLLSSTAPCNYILFPVLLFQFGINNKESKIQYKQILLFTSIFLAVITFTGLFLSYLIPYTSFKFLFGGLLIVWGMYQLKNPGYTFFKSNKTQLWILAILTPFIVTLSPCSLPFFSAFITLQSSISKLNIIFNFLAFGLGLLTPSFLLALLGNKFSNLIKKTYKLTAALDKIAGVFIILSGLYFIHQIHSISKKDLVITGFLVFISILIYFYKQVSSKKAIWSQDLIILITTWFIFISSLYICNTLVPKESVTITTCNTHTSCSYCQICSFLFMIFTLLSAFLFIYIDKKIKVQIESSK